MAKIPIISVPEAPMADASLAPAPMVKPPTERYQEATNFEKHIPGLMQKELDPRPFQARAAAQMGIGKTLVRTGSEFIDLSFAMQRSKDSSDISRVKLLNANVLEQFNEKVAANNIPLSQQAALWQGEFEPKIDDHIAQLRPSGGVLDRIALENDTFKRGTRANIWDRANKEQIKSDFEAMESDYKMSLEEGDYEGAGEAVERMVQAQAISKGRAHEMLNGIKRANLEGDLAKTPPREGLAEMIEIEETGESDVFGKLHPALVKKWKNEFQNQIDDKTRETYKSLEEHKKAGMLTSYEDVINVANGNLTPVQLEMWREIIEADPVYDEGKIVQMETEIRSYRSENDTGLKIFDELERRIHTEVPENLQGLLSAKLHNEAQRVREGKASPRGEELNTQAGKLLFDMAQLGYFDQGGYDSKKLAGMKPEEREQYNRANWDGYTATWVNTRERQDSIEAFIKEKGDSVTRTEIIAELNKMVAPEKRGAFQKQTNYQAFLRRQAEDLGIIPGRRSLPVAPSAGEVRERLQPRSTPGYAVPGGPGKETSMNEKFIDVIKKLEGFEPIAKWDAKQYSVGYGTRGKKGEKLTPEQADARLRSELADHAQNVDSAAEKIGLRLTEGQRAALISFDFNTGRGGYLIRTSKGDTDEILRRLQLYVKSEGETLPGLVNRRRREAELFMT